MIFEQKNKLKLLQWKQIFLCVECIESMNRSNETESISNETESLWNCQRIAT